MTLSIIAHYSGFPGFAPIFMDYCLEKLLCISMSMRSTAVAIKRCGCI